MATTRYRTAAQIINDAAVECGLSEVVDPFSSTDANFRLFVRLLNSTGNELANEGGWEQLRKEATLTVGVGDTGFYSLPDDYRAMVNDTAWNRTTTFPLGGPVSSQQAQFLKARTISSTLFFPFRIIGSDLEIIGTLPAVGSVLALEYESDSWVKPATSSEPDADQATLSSDTIYFDPVLMLRALKYHWRGERGLDVTKALDDYRTSLAAARSVVPLPVLDMAGPEEGRRMLDHWNVSDTGYGS